LRILLDECVDWRLARELPGHEVETVKRMGWLSAENGALLTLAAKEFDAFITVDKNLPISRTSRPAHCQSSCCG
jgi:hypothetical protein